MSVPPRVDRAAVALLVISSMLLALRFWSRAIVTKTGTRLMARYWWDDWVALATLPLIIADTACVLIWVQQGLEKSVLSMSLDEAVTWNKMFFIQELFFEAAITLPKISALLFYFRVLVKRSNNKTLRISLFMVSITTIIWWVCASLLITFSCRPVKKFWAFYLPGSCIDPHVRRTAQAAVSVFFDLLVLLLPLPAIWSLALSTARRICVFVVFLCGYGVLAVSTGRLAVMIESLRSSGNLTSHSLFDVEVKNRLAIHWTIYEAPIALISICLPSLFSLVKRGADRGLMSLLSSTAQEYPHHRSIKSNSKGAAYHVQDTNILIDKQSGNSSSKNFALSTPDTRYDIEMQNWRL